MKLRSRHPFADLTIYADDPAPVEQVRQALERGPEVHPDARELGVELALGFIPHRGENRRTRRAAVANWQPPKQDYKAHNSSESGATPAQRDEAEGLRVPPPHDMPTRRELLKQRKRRDRGTLDVDLRRLTRKALTK